jgi:hypothetical protein
MNFDHEWRGRNNWYVTCDEVALALADFSAGLMGKWS